MELKTYRAICAKLDFRRSPVMLIRQLLCDAGLLAAAIYLLNTHTLTGYLVAQMLLPIVFFRGFALMHEAVHHTTVRNKLVNEVVGVLAGTVCFLPYESWKRMHLEHHTWAGNIDKDPTLLLRKEYDPSKPAKYRFISAVWRSWVPLLSFMQTVVFWKYPVQQLRDPDIPNGQKGWIAASAIVPATVYAGLWLVWPETFNLITLVPAVFLYLMLLENINAPHHLDVHAFRGTHKLSIPEQYLATRTGYYPRWLSRFVFLNFNLHTEHHLFPSLPWHRLDEARPLVKSALGEAYNESEGNAWIREHRKHDLSCLLQPPSPGHNEEKWPRAG